MDPISILATAAAASKIAWCCSTALGTFIQDATNADQTVKLLYSETENLRRTLSSITIALEAPSLGRYEQLPLWEDVNNCLLECNKTLETFSQTLESFGKAQHGKSNVFKSATQAFKLNIKEDEIRTLRAQLHSHTAAMQMVLQMITVHISSTAPDMVLETLTPQLRTLVNLVVDLHKSSLPPGVSNQGLQSSRTKLERSAKELASKASAVLSSRSTAWSGSQAEQQALFFRTTKQSVTTGSEFGEPLSAETRRRISQWMAADLGDDDSASVQEESPSTFSEPHLSSVESHMTPETPIFASIVNNEVYPDASDEEDEAAFELEIARRYLCEGQNKTQSDPAQAEEFLRKAVEKYKTMGPTQATANVPHITLEIAQLCFDQDKVSATMELCTPLLADTPMDDQARSILLQASYLVSQVHLRSGRFEEALVQCRRTLKGRRRFGGKSAAYFQNVALMAAIYRHKGDEVEALAYEGLLPLGFSKPKFKFPGSPDFASSFGAEQKAETVQASASESQASIDLVVAKQVDAMMAAKRRTSNERSDISLSAHTRLTQPLKPLGPQSTSPPTTESHVSKYQRTNRSRFVSARPLKGALRVFRGKSSDDNPTKPLTNSMSNKEPLQESSGSAMVGKDTQTIALKILKKNGRASFTESDIKDNFLWAASAGHESVVRLLLLDWVYQSSIQRPGSFSGTAHEVHLKSVDVNTLDDRGRSALHLAAISGHSGVVKILLDSAAIRCDRSNGIDADGQYTLSGLGRTPVECAIKGHHAETVGQFVSFGIAENGLDHQGYTLLHHAAVSGTAELVNMMLNEGLELRAHTNQGETPLHLASLYGRSHIVDLLLGKGADPEGKDHNGSTPLLLAAAAGDSGCMKKLKDAGATITTKNAQNSTMLHVAAQNGHVDALDAEVFEAVDINCRNTSGQTPLFLATYFGHGSSVEILLSRGACVDTIDHNDNAPAHVAAAFGFMPIMERLLSAGANARLMNYAGQTPLAIATRNRREDVIQLLESHENRLEAT